MNEILTITNMLGDPNWKAFSKALNEAKGFHPNKAFYNVATREAAILIDQSSRGDFALSKNALDYVIAAELQGDKVSRAFIVLRERGNALLRRLPARDVQNNLSGVDPIDGQFGLYWWIDRGLRSART